MFIEVCGKCREIVFYEDFGYFLYLPLSHPPISKHHYPPSEVHDNPLGPSLYPESDAVPATAFVCLKNGYFFQGMINVLLH